MDPISLIATALAAGGLAALKSGASTVITDAYAGLKRVIQDRYEAAQASVEQLEQAPESKGRRAVVEEELAATGAATDPDLLAQAQALIDLVRTQDPETAKTVGLELTGYKAKEFEAEGVTAEADTGDVIGVHMSEAEIDGKASYRNITARRGPDHPKAQEP